MSKQPSLAEVLRAAIRCSGVTQVELSQQLGISQPNLSNFLSRKQGLSLQNADRLMQYLGLVVVPKDDFPRSSR